MSKIIRLTKVSGEKIEIDLEKVYVCISDVKIVCSSCDEKRVTTVVLSTVLFRYLDNMEDLCASTIINVEETPEQIEQLVKDVYKE